MIPILRISRLRSAIMDKIRRLRSCILNIRPHLQIIPICNFETFEDGKTGMYRSLDLSGPKILKTSLDLMLNPGIATKNIVCFGEVLIFFEDVIQGIFDLVTLGSWNIPEYHVPRKSRSWETPSTSVHIQNFKIPKLQNF
jgi:hypothetical protein